MDQIKKKFIKIFKEVGFKTEIETNLKIIDVLDAPFNLTNDTYQLKRIRSIIWFNPPFSRNVTTEVAKTNLLDLLIY